MKKVIYKVYCGKNGKFYSYNSEQKALNLYDSLIEQNYRTYIIKITNGQEEIILDYR